MIAQMDLRIFIGSVIIGIAIGTLAVKMYCDYCLMIKPLVDFAKQFRTKEPWEKG